MCVHPYTASYISSQHLLVFRCNNHVRFFRLAAAVAAVSSIRRYPGVHSRHVILLCDAEKMETAERIECADNEMEKSKELLKIRYFNLK